MSCYLSFKKRFFLIWQILVSRPKNKLEGNSFCPAIAIFLSNIWKRSNKRLNECKGILELLQIYLKASHLSDDEQWDEKSTQRVWCCAALNRYIDNIEIFV